MKRIVLILLFLCGMLWAKPSVFIPPIELEGVHKDYADQIVQVTKDYLEKLGDVRVVTEAREGDFYLQIKLLRRPDGVLVEYSLLDPDDKTEAWNYKHMAYTPDDLPQIANLASLKFGQWDGLKFGLGLGLLGLASPEFDALPAVDFLVQYLYGNALFSWDFTYGYDIVLDLNTEGESYCVASFLSVAYVFDGKKLFPYVGPGVGYAFMGHNSNDYAEEDGGLSLFLKAGAIYRPIGYNTSFALDLRYLYNGLEFQNLDDGRRRSVHGWSVNAQVWW